MIDPALPEIAVTAPAKLHRPVGHDQAPACQILMSIAGVGIQTSAAARPNPCQAGERMLSEADTMDLAPSRLAESAATGIGLSGTVGISLSEGFGTSFVARYLPQFLAAHPALTVDLVASSGFLSPSGKEADLAVVLSRPRSTVMAGKLTDYRLRLHASPGYFAYKQMPRSTADLTRNHCLVGYIPDLPSDPTLRYLAELSAGLFATIRNSSINAQHLLVAAGAGIGVLPYFMSDRDRSLLPMKQGESIVLDRGPHATPVYSPASAPSSSGSSKWSRSSHRLAMRQ